MAGVEVSRAEARRMAIRAQGLAGRPGKPTARQVRAVVSTLGAVQLDAVNVLARAHYLAVYSRVGPYRTRVLDEVVYRKRQAFEYWGHAASLLPIELQPALRWRMDWYAGHKNWRGFLQRLDTERPGYVAAVEREVAERGPLTFGELTDPARTDPAKTTYAASSVLWERWSDGRSVLEGLFDAGRLAAAGRRGFERQYDLTERVIPADVLALPTPEPADAQRTLVLHAAKALGVATARDLADYFRLPAAATKARLRELVDAGELAPARVEDWPDPAYLHPGARAGSVDARALLSPFDSLLWERGRVERLFGFRHSFELYVKPAKRVYGYYVLPFLLGDALVGRVDLKADRQRGALLVQSAFAEPGGADVTALADELRTMAGWLELDTIEVGDRGDLARPLRRALGGTACTSQDASRSG
jgi:uncharacterized protein